MEIMRKITLNLIILYYLGLIGFDWQHQEDNECEETYYHTEYISNVFHGDWERQ